MEGELWRIIQAHLDRYGVYEAVFARRMGTSPSTINTWKVQGVKRLPERRLLEAVARETATPYEDVLQAALMDIGYLGPDVMIEGSDVAPESAPEPAPGTDVPEVRHPGGDTRRVWSRPAHAPRQPRVVRSSDTRSHDTT